MEIENQNTFLAALENPINLFLSAGFSVLARDRNGEPLPTGNQLAQELRAHFSLEDLSALDLDRLCTVISQTRSDELREYLTERFTVVEFDPCYLCLEERLRISTVFTTNIDNLINRIFERSTEWYINDMDLSGPVYRRRRAIDLATLHGSVTKPDRPLRFGAAEVASSFGADRDRWLYLQGRLMQSPTIFWGCSLRDAPVLEALILHATRSGPLSDAWILVRPSSPLEVEQYFRALNLQIVRGDTADLLQFIEAHVQVHPTRMSVLVSRDTEGLFPSARIPSPGTVPSRPIVEFFRGAAPMWCDIFSGALYRTSYHDKVRNSVHSGEHTIITGIPGTGKTTLLMQIAADIAFEGHKLVYGELSKAEAELVARRLREDNALILIDNFTNDVDAFSHLSQHPNVTLVAAERDYSLTPVLHMIPRDNCSILDVTELSDQDMQGCRLTIPQSIRTPRYNRPEVTAGLRPSLLEFVQDNITEPTLRQRFERALRTLRATSPRLAEMLLFVAYIHACRTPVSMDMALAYWRGSIRHFSEIYNLVHEVGALMTEYEGDLADEPQDYFAARSIIVAESILGAADDTSLRTVLLRFHRNISPLRICHYNIFRRHAYDHKLIGRAFSSWQEGQDFYERIYEKEPNPYVRQHEALFLSGRGRHAEAFSAIDQALAESRRYNWTIRNSHAVILFRRNITFADDPTARQSLNRSMDILRTCYDSDRRKAFHAMVFADLATKYWDAYHDAQAREYLQHAHRWLLEQREREPWLDAIPRLLRSVQRRLPEHE